MLWRPAAAEDRRAASPLDQGGGDAALDSTEVYWWPMYHVPAAAGIGYSCATRHT
jgi:hypothetical protein